MKNPVTGRFQRFAAGLRFPWLLLLTLALFVLDLVIPDLVPFVDEVLLGLLALILASLRTKRREGAPQGEISERSES